MPWPFSFLLVLTVAAVSGDFQDHKLVLKTFRQAQVECKQYLRSSVNSIAICEPRCIEIVLRSWTDCKGLLTISFGRHFQPDFADTDYVNRTQVYLNVALADASADDYCCQASLAWQCYRDQYGNAVGIPRLAPSPDILVAGAIYDCARMLEIGYWELRYGAMFRFEFSSKTRSLMRCVLIRLGLYNDVTGPDLDRMYVQCGGYQIDELIFKKDVRKCVDRLVSQCLDNSTLATRIVSQCFPMGIGPLDIITNIVKVVASLVRPVAANILLTIKKIAPGLSGRIIQEVLFPVLVSFEVPPNQYLEWFGTNAEASAAILGELDPVAKGAILQELNSKRFRYGFGGHTADMGVN